jgi:hypothetical protein
VGQLSGSVEERLAALDAELEAFQRGPQRDDTTVLVLEYRGGGSRSNDAERAQETTSEAVTTSPEPPGRGRREAD